MYSNEILSRFFKNKLIIMILVLILEQKKIFDIVYNKPRRINQLASALSSDDVATDVLRKLRFNGHSRLYKSN